MVVHIPALAVHHRIVVGIGELCVELHALVAQPGRDAAEDGHFIRSQMVGHIRLVDVGRELSVVVVEDGHAVSGADACVVRHDPRTERAAQFIERVAVFVAPLLVRPSTQIGNLALVVGVVEPEIPLEVLRLDGRGVDAELDTAVDDGARIGQNRAETAGHRDVLRHVEVFGLDIVEVEGDVHARIQHRHVQSDIGLGRGFPAQFAVAELSVAVTRFAVVGRVVVAVERSEVAHAVLVTRRTVAGAQFQLVEPLRVVEPRLRRDEPAGADRPERGAGVVLVEFRRGVVAKRGRKVVLVGDRIAGLREERHEVAHRAAAADRGREKRRTRLVADTGRRLHHVGIQVVAREVRRVPFALEHLHTGYGVERMSVGEILIDVDGIGPRVAE